MAWREFLCFEKQNDSNNYNKLVPDSASWYKVYSGNYLKPNDFDNYPVVGIDFFQVSLFCEWRSEVVSKRTGKEIIYYLPSKEEFNLAVDFFNKNEFTAKLSDVHIIDKKSKVKGLCSNVSEMTNVEGFAIGANWNSESASCYLQSTYTENSEYVGFRCFAKFVK
ncbi:MAG: SUMF1/EgtB/PvdO family nonheme iron enzyme [Bacteroidetes bacterium]|nr:SUMF1/EgtB/PvdO family nonheme iron enzyme [Bacteroidota bacterium]